MSLANPWALLLLPPAALVLWLQLRAERAARERRAALAPTSLLRRQNAEPTPWRATTRLALYGAATLLAIVALTRPQAGTAHGVTSGTGADVLLVLDLSNSMAVRDVHPNRFAQAVYTAAAVLDRVAPMDRVALAVFADEGQLECPLTRDLDLLLTRLVQMKPGLVGEGSSDLSQAISLICDQFPSPDTPGLAILLSDGEDLVQGVTPDRLHALSQSGAVVVAVGVGTPQGGRVPATGPFGGLFGDLLWNNQPVTSRLNEDALRALSGATGGKYLRLADSNPSSAAELALSARRSVLRPPTIQAGRRDRVPRECFQLPLALAILALLVDLVVAVVPTSLPRLTGSPPKERQTPPTTQAWPRARPTWLAVSLAFALPFGLFGTRGREADEQGRAALESGDYTAAIEAFERGLADYPESPELLYSLGVAQYRQERFEDARTCFEEAASLALSQDRDALAEQALFAVGDALFRQGRYAEAIQAYDRALELDPDDTEARENRALAERMLQQPPSAQPQQSDQPQQGAGSQSSQEQGGAAEPSQGHGQESEPSPQPSSPLEEETNGVGTSQRIPQPPPGIQYPPMPEDQADQLLQDQRERERAGGASFSQGGEDPLMSDLERMLRGLTREPGGTQSSKPPW